MDGCTGRRRYEAKENRILLNRRVSLHSIRDNAHSFMCAIISIFYHFLARSFRTHALLRFVVVSTYLAEWSLWNERGDDRVCKHSKCY